MNFVVILSAFFFAIQCVSGSTLNEILTTVPDDKYAISRELLNRHECAFWEEHFGPQPDKIILGDAANHTIQTDNLECLRFILDEYEHPMLKLLTRQAILTAIKSKKNDVLRRLFPKINNLAPLLSTAIQCGNCDAIRILITKLREYPEMFRPHDSFEPIAIEDIQQDGGRIFYDLIDSDFFLNHYTHQLLLFNYPDFNEEELLSLLERIPMHHWALLAAYIFTSLRRACEYCYDHAIQYILDRFSLADFVSKNAGIVYMAVKESVMQDRIIMIQVLRDTGLDFGALTPQSSENRSLLDCTIEYSCP